MNLITHNQRVSTREGLREARALSRRTWMGVPSSGGGVLRWCCAAAAGHGHGSVPSARQAVESSYWACAR
eukprot:546913-Prymnesium_polylepis.1